MKRMHDLTVQGKPYHFKWPWLSKLVLKLDQEKKIIRGQTKAVCPFTATILRGKKQSMCGGD